MSSNNSGAGGGGSKILTLLIVVALALSVVALLRKPKPGTTILDTLPSGSIIIWSGDLNNIPDGWVACDGKNNTPNLQGRVVLGPGNSNTPGSVLHTIGDKDTGVGGAEQYSLTMLQVPSHAHTFYQGNAGGTSGYSVAGSGQRFTQETGYTGGNPDKGNENYPYDIMPPYLVLAYIMKL